MLFPDCRMRHAARQPGLSHQTQITVANRDSHHLSHSEIGCAKRILNIYPYPRCHPDRAIKHVLFRGSEAVFAEAQRSYGLQGRELLFFPRAHQWRKPFHLESRHRAPNERVQSRIRLRFHGLCGPASYRFRRSASACTGIFPGT